MEIQDRHFARIDTIDYSVRGFFTTPDSRQFTIYYYRDKFGNISGIQFGERITFLFEQLLDESKFSPLQLSVDTEIGYSWVLSKFMGCAKTDGSGARLAYQCPAIRRLLFAFNVGASYKRFCILWGRRPDQPCLYLPVT